MKYIICLDPLDEKKYLRVVNNENGSIEEDSVSMRKATRFNLYSEAIEICEILDLPKLIKQVNDQEGWE
jgi:hypothetical protein